GVDILGSKKGFNADRPWLFEDFDQFQFYQVSEEEYEKELALFNSGRYEHKWEEVTFDMEEHNRLLRDTKDEVTAIRARQRKAQAEMDKLETELLEKWAKEHADRGVPMYKVQSLLQGMFHRTPWINLCAMLTSPLDPNIVPIEAPLNANVWKVEVNQGDQIKP